MVSNLEEIEENPRATSDSEAAITEVNSLTKENERVLDGRLWPSLCLLLVMVSDFHDKTRNNH